MTLNKQIQNLDSEGHCFQYIVSRSAWSSCRRGRGRGEHPCRGLQLFKLPTRLEAVAGTVSESTGEQPLENSRWRTDAGEGDNRGACVIRLATKGSSPKGYHGHFYERGVREIARVQSQSRGVGEEAIWRGTRSSKYYPREYYEMECKVTTIS